MRPLDAPAELMPPAIASLWRSFLSQISLQKAGQIIDRLDRDGRTERAPVQALDHSAVAAKEDMSVQLWSRFKTPGAVSVEVAFMLKTAYPLLDLGDCVAGLAFSCRQKPEFAISDGLQIPLHQMTGTTEAVYLRFGYAVWRNSTRLLRQSNNYRRGGSQAGPRIIY
jgi:hypothetical protein